MKFKNYPLTFCLVCKSLDYHSNWPTILETCWSEKPENLVRFSLAENHWCTCYFCLIHFTLDVIPLSFSGTCSKHVATLFAWWIVRFTSVSCYIAAQQSVVCPVELCVCFAVKTKPGAIVHDFWLLENKIEDKLIFGSCSDFNQVSSKLQAVSSCVIPL